MPLGTCAFGRAIDAQGRPIDGRRPLRGRRIAIDARAPLPRERVPAGEPFWTGIRAIDGLLTLGRGARVGIFGPPGTGKSSLLQTIVENASADAIVVALAGERGCEAQRWIERPHPAATIVCETSDKMAWQHVLAAQVAMAHAVALREAGMHVLLLIDSLARVAAALRDLAVAAGEPLGRAGYPASVFPQMARLLECAGATRRGSITLVATVLEGGDERDPIGEAARSYLDGHLTLSEKLADAGRFPAIDAGASLSRTQALAVSVRHLNAARRVRHALALLERVDEARALGIVPSDPATLAAIGAEERLEAFLRQPSGRSGPSQTLSMLDELADMLVEPHGHQ